MEWPLESWQVRSAIALAIEDWEGGVAQRIERRLGCDARGGACSVETVFVCCRVTAGVFVVVAGERSALGFLGL